MTTDISQAQGLELTLNQNRLTATLGANANEIINAVVLERGNEAKLMIMAHYASLPFGSKPEEYWNGKFKEDYAGLCIMSGIRNFTENLGLLDLKNCILEDYPIHNEESLRNAVKMNLKGILGDVVEPFGEFNRVFVTKIMSGYEKKLRSDHKRAIEIREKLKPEKEEPTQSDLDKQMRQSIEDRYVQYTYELRNDIELFAYVDYDFMVKNGITLVSDDRKLKLMDEAKAYCAQIERETAKSTVIIPKELNPDSVKTIAKRMAVRDYFNQLITNRVEKVF